MRRGTAVLLALAWILASPEAIGAGKDRVRWVTSIYVDSEGVGLKYPEGVGCTDDVVVVGDTGNNRLVRYRYDGPAVTADGEFPLRKAYPIIVQLGPKGDIYFLDGKERRIVLVSAEGEEKGVLDPKNVPSAREVIPKSFRVDETGNIYILDVFSGQVLVLDSDGQYLRHVRFPDEYGFFSDLAVDRLGGIFLVDGVEAKVYFAGKSSDAFSPLTESLKEYMNFPARLTIDQRGIIYLVDQNGSGLGIVGQDGSFMGRRLSLGWNQTGLYYPSQICISPNGSVFIADRNNSRVQMYMLGDK